MIKDLEGENDMSDFEKWWVNNIHQPYRTEYTAAKAAYEAGRKTGLEEAAEIAEQSIGENWACCTNSVLGASAAIRERIKQ